MKDNERLSKILFDRKYTLKNSQMKLLKVRKSKKILETLNLF